MFHLEQGLCFERLPDGGVRIVKYREPFLMDGTDKSEWDVEVNAYRWASVVASVTPTSGTPEAYLAAERLHRGDCGRAGGE